MDVKIARMCPIDESTVDQRDPAGGGRNLDAASPWMSSAQPETRGSEFGHPFGSERRAQFRSKDLFQVADATIRERADADALDGIERAQDPGKRFNNCVMFRVDVDTKIRPGGEKVLEQWNWFLSIHERLANLAPGKLLDNSHPIGHTVKTIVMEGKNFPI